MSKVTQAPLVRSIHRTLVFLIQRSGVASEWLFTLYSRAWVHVAPLQIAKTKFGATIECDLRDRIPAFIFHFGHWEPNLTRWISRRLRHGDCFVDVGSNIGYYTLLASSIVGSRGDVVAIEASPTIFAQLTRSIAANHCDNVRPLNVAVAADPGRVTIFFGPSGNSGATSTLKEWRGGEPEAQVTALPLNQILTSEDMRRTRLIKIDVEGAEAPILRQIAETIDSYRDDLEILVECSPANNRQLWEEILADFLRAGFHAFAIENKYSASWYLQWRRPSAPMSLSRLPAGQTDVLFTRHDLADSPR